MSFFEINNNSELLDSNIILGHRHCRTLIKYLSSNKPIIQGRDICSRFFFVIWVLIECADRRYCCLQTFFNKYTNNEILWSSYGIDDTIFINTDGGLNNSQIGMLQCIIAGDTCKFVSSDKKIRFLQKLRVSKTIKIRLATTTEINNQLSILKW